MKRPIVILAIGIYLGIIGGDILIDKQYISPFFIFLVLLVIFLILIGLKQHVKVLSIGLIIGIVIIIISPVQRERNILDNQTNSNQIEPDIKMVGSVISISENKYFKQLILKDVEIQNLRLDSNVKVLIPNNKTHTELDKQAINRASSSQITLNDKVRIKGNFREIALQMNPSDFDSEKYLLSENISYEVEALDIEVVELKNNFVELVRESISNKIDIVFRNKDFGILHAIILGDDSKLDEDIHDLYMKTGIGHILCISGFHVSLIMAVALGIIYRIGIGYQERYIITMAVVWIYSFFTGVSTSTVRASIMITIFIGSRLLIEEDDNFNSLALASILILIFRPYQLFMPGFQLSFIAVLGISLGNEIIRRRKLDNKLKKWHKIILPWIMIQLSTSLPLMYHFYEVPFISSLLNFIIIPIFSLVLILGWIIIGISYISMEIATLSGDIIHVILNIINMFVRNILNIPFSTILLGRPSNINIIIYIMGVFLFVYGFGRYFKSLIKYQICILSLGIGLIVINLFPNNLDISLLYVGQGDGSVIITPNNKVVVIDGGKTGKGTTMKNYLKFRGKDEIDIMILSHSDEDHVGGLIQLLTDSIAVKEVIVSKYDDSDKLNQFINICKDRDIRVTPMVRGDIIKLGETNIDILAPKLNLDEGNANDNSLVCSIKYRDFTALFTGDKSVGNENLFYNNIEDISVLKVSHHGSKTGTSDELLLKTTPLYAMISCGKNNSYGHPHKEVTNMLEKYNIAYDKTSSDGAIIIETDGRTMNISKHREE